MKTTITFISFLSTLVIPALAHAQTQFDISSNIPGSYPTSSGPTAFVANFYQFALIIGGVLAFGMIVWGGIRYTASAGNSSGQSEAKNIITSALLGLALLLGAYLVLDVINPQLLNLNLPALTGISAAAPTISGTGASGITGTGSGGGTSGTGTGSGSGSGSGTGSGGGKCQAPSNGPCANVSNLGCFGGAASTMQAVCNRESGGNAAIGSGVDIGADGKSVSWGLFQINISATSLIDPKTGQRVPCSTAFSGGAYTAKNHSTRVVNQALYDQCVKLAQDPTANITNACSLSKGGTYLTPWITSNKACGI